MPAGTNSVAAFECATLLSRFAHCLDGRDYPALLDLLAPDCIWHGPKDAQGHAAILARLQARPADMVTLHVVTNVAVDIIDRSNAASRSYLTVYRFDGIGAQAAPFPLSGPHTVAVYDDRFVHIEGRWLISERRMTPIAQMQLSADAANTVPPTGKEVKNEVRSRRFGWLGWFPPC